MPSKFTGAPLPEHVSRQLAADVRKLFLPLPILWDMLTDPEITISRRNTADVYWHYRDRPNVLAIEIPDVEFNPETGAVILPGNRFGVLVLQ